MDKKTFWIIIAGIITFQIFSIIQRVNYKGKIVDDENIKSKEIKISLQKAIALLFIFILLASFYYISIARITNTYNFMKIASIYRNLSISSEVQINAYARLCLTIIKSMSIVLICVCINNIFSKKFRKNYGILLALCIMIYAFITIISGERASLLRVFGIVALVYSIYWLRNNKYKNFNSIKYIILGTIGLIVLLYIFSSIRHFVGRKSELDLLDYISLYAGGSIYNFNHFITNFTQATMDGSSTFIGLLNNLSRLGIGEIHSIHREVVIIQSKNLFLGNVYTCFYDYYKDFGFYGMIVLISVYSSIINLLYNRCKYSTQKTLTKIAIFVFFGASLFFSSFTEQFFSSYITISTIESLIIMYVTILFISAKQTKDFNYKIQLL